jgi:transcriptional regulator of arginine metabolism
MKRLRQAAILELVESERIPRQEVLRTRLLARGFNVTQATLSRDIKELGLLKRATDGAYQRSDRVAEQPRESRDQALTRAVADYLVRAECVGHLMVLRTDPGEAQPLAWAIDRATLVDVAGTLGGDDTILVVARSPEAAQALTARFLSWVGPAKGPNRGGGMGESKT